MLFIQTVIYLQTESFALNLFGLSGATFANNETEYSVVAYIENDDSPNSSPILATEISNLTATEDELFEFTLAQDTFNDVDTQDSLTYSATLADGSPLPSWLIFNADTRTLSGTPVNNDVGTLNLQITATDLAGDTASDSFDLEVVNVNDVPLDINLSNTSIDENSSNGTIIGNLSTVDPDLGDTYSYTLLNNAEGRFVIDGSQLKVANGDLLNFEASSNHLITIQTTDGVGLSLTKDFKIDLNDLNEAPIAVNDSFTANSKTTKVITIESLLSNDSDPEGNPLSLTTLGNAINGTVVIDGNNIIFTPDGNSSTGSFDYSISDGVFNNSAEVTLDVQVAEVGSNGNDTIIGTPRNDTYQGLDGDDSISGKSGDDLINGDANNDTLDGGLNNDTLFGGSGNDILIGGSGNDTLVGQAGVDSLIGGEGNDVLVAEGSGDVLKGGSGNDTYNFTLSQITGEIEISEESGFDLVNFTEDSGESVGLSLSDFGLGRVGIKKSDRDLLVDINRDGIIDLKSDLSITNYFNENGAAGSGTIEQLGNVSSDAIIQYTQSSNITNGSTVYRFFNTSNRVHFYTASEIERDVIQNNLPHYVYEGASYVGAPHDEDILTGAKPVYRFFNTNTGGHFYTIAEAERDAIIENLPNYNFEGVAYYGYESPQENTQALYRFYNSVIDAHFYTPNAAEKDFIVANLPDQQLETNGNSDAAFYVQPLF